MLALVHPVAPSPSLDLPASPSPSPSPSPPSRFMNAMAASYSGGGKLPSDCFASAAAAASSCGGDVLDTSSYVGGGDGARGGADGATDPDSSPFSTC